MIAATQIASSITARPFAGARVSSVRNGSRVQMAKVGNWFPGSDTPAYLDALPASYGFGRSLGRETMCSMRIDVSDSLLLCVSASIIERFADDCMLSETY